MVVRYFFIVLLSMMLGTEGFGKSRVVTEKASLVYKFDIKEEIGPGIWKKMQKALAEAKELEATVFLIHMNTYGGVLISADSMRTAILQNTIPTYVFIDNNAASAGALISIAADSIYMRSGASIGAATVVSGTDGKEMPDKYQSYMRSMMRATAEAHGGDTIIVSGQQKILWSRDPAIAEAMVDDRVVIPNVIDSGKTLTFTTNEALLNGYCEGRAESISEVLHLAGIKNYEIKSYEPSLLQNIISLLVNPALQGILLLIIMGGIWFELQSPGIGFPILAALVAALLYFMPLILEGLAVYWEVGLFALGILLLLVEVFVIPGFGLAGISGVLLIITGLVLSLVGHLDFEFNPEQTYKELFVAVFQVMLSLVLFLGLVLVFGKTLTRSATFRRITLAKEMTDAEGYLSSNPSYKQYIGEVGIVQNDLRPSGTIRLGGEYLDAVAISGFIAKGSQVLVKKYELGQLYVELMG